MVHERVKFEFKPKRKVVFNHEENLPADEYFPVKPCLWIMLVVLIFLSAALGISAYSIVMIKNLAKNVELLNREVTKLKFSITTTVDDNSNYQREDIYVTLPSTVNNPPLIDGEIYSGDNSDDLNDSNISTVFINSEEENIEFNENGSAVFKLIKLPPLSFLKVGAETQHREKRNAGTVDTVPLSFVGNSNFKYTKDNPTGKQNPLKLNKSLPARKHDLNLENSQLNFSAVEELSDPPAVLHLSKKKLSKRFKRIPQVKSGSQWESVEEGIFGPEMTIVRDGDGQYRRNRHRQRNNIETLDERVHSCRSKLFPAIHFHGDTSKYVLGRHTNYNGDGHLRHLNQRYVDWVSPDWVSNLSMDQHFSMNDGFLKIKETGLYFIYAQIYYLDEHDTNGYRVYKNSETVLQCTAMTHSATRVLKGNTCYTSGVAHLLDGDQLSVEDLAEGRYSLFEVGKSFFGVVKLGEVKNKSK